MNALIRAIWPDFDPGATVEEAGIEPSPAPPVDIADLDRNLVTILASDESQPEAAAAESEPATATQR
jgi:hypothetical protein